MTDEPTEDTIPGALIDGPGFTASEAPPFTEPKVVGAEPAPAGPGVIVGQLRSHYVHEEQPDGSTKARLAFFDEAGTEHPAPSLTQ